MNDNEIRKPNCQLVGTDGNAFSIIGRVASALKKDGQPTRAAHWFESSKRCKSYDDLLALTHEYVEVL